MKYRIVLTSAYNGESMVLDVTTEDTNYAMRLWDKYIDRSDVTMQFYEIYPAE